MSEIVVDFETYFDMKYSLKNLTSSLYVRDERFLLYGAGIQVNAEPPQWIRDCEQLRQIILGLRPVTVIMHNGLFDGLILVERIGIPRSGITWADTLSMARGSVLAKDYSLKTLSEGSETEKLDMPSIAGIRALSHEQEEALSTYCKADVVATRALYDRFKRDFPPDELELIDLTTEMGVRARLELNKELLAEALTEAVAEREQIIAAAGVDPKILSSNPKFAAWLVEHGLDPPTKISVTTGKTATAFSKNDLSYIRFKEKHDDFAPIFAAREATKSTLGISRTKTFMDIADSGRLPVPLAYYGANTGRWSSRDGIGIQNLPRGGALRRSITAPDGFVICVGDLGQIEARVLAMLAGQESMIATFRAGLDLYTEFAKAHFQKDEINKDERQLAKAMCLGLQFGMGINKFRDSVAKGFMGTQPVHLTEREARQAVNNYRRINHSIVSYWEAAEHEALELAMQLAPLSSVDWGGYFKIEYNAIRLPNGMRLRYPGLWRGEDGGLSFFNGKGREAIYSGKIVENCIAAGTLVITTRGATPIEQVGLNDQIWDGLEFVSHNGLAPQGLRPTIDFCGVALTPDHQVLTQSGWIPASEASVESLQQTDAPPSQRHNGANPRVLNRPTLPGQQWTKRVMGSAMRVWEHAGNGRWRLPKKPILRLHESDLNRQTQRYAQEIQAPSLCGIPVYESPLRATVPSCLEKLWRTWDYSLQKLGGVRGFLVRHGRELQKWFATGSRKQRPGVQQRELPVVNPEREYAAHAKNSADRHPKRANERGASRKDIQHRGNDTALPTITRCGERRAVHTPGCPQPVFDILNCGPRSRFAVIGTNKQLFLVHNCTQAVARLFMADAWRAISKLYPVVLSCHDELGILAPEDDAEAACTALEAAMTTPPAWMPDIPLTAEVQWAKNYSK
jgi:DNA polymerase